MRPPTANSLLEVWEAGRDRHPIDRGLLLFSLACPESDPDDLADETLGQRNDAILRLRFATFGSAVRGYADCPECQARMELDVDGRDLLGPPSPAGAAVQVEEATFRIPTSRDLAAVASGGSGGNPALRLLLLCADGPNEALDPDRAAQLLHPVDGAMEEADPMAEIRLSLSCDSCGHPWAAAFDVVEFVWDEVEAYAVHLLDQIHVLASAYGWREETILSLSESRRAAYIRRILA
jgi:hypothetical protein